MSLLSTAVGMGTAAIDGMFVGQEVSKAVLKVDPDDTRAAELAGVELTFQFNPENIKIQRRQSTSRTPVTGKSDVQENQNAAPKNESTMTISQVIFDTYEDKPNKSVYTEYIEKLERFVGYDKDKHAPAKLLFHWGKFTEERSNKEQLKVMLDNLDVDFTMFLNDGTPVRAKVNMTLRLGMTAKEQQAVKPYASPDHAKMVTIKRGDTLADIAAVEYDNPDEWRRIANANGIDDPMHIAPGMKLLVPPILR